jgi:tetratricopeptide (TPR) repeat protein
MADNDNASNAPARGGGGVTSLLDRLPRARRVRHVAETAMRGRVEGEEEIEKLGEIAVRLDRVDPERWIAELGHVPPGDPELDGMWTGFLAMRTAQRFLRGDVEGALTEWDEAIAQNPDGAREVHLFRGLLLALHGHEERALADMNRVVELEPRKARSYTLRGDLYLRMKRLDEAMANYVRAARIDRHDRSAHEGMAECLLARGEDERAIKWFSRAIKLAPRRRELRVGRAICHEHLGQLAEAIADLDVAVAVDPNDAEAWHLRGRCRQETQLPEAIADLDRAIALEPDRADHYTMRGFLHMLNVAIFPALADAKRAVELDPKNAEIDWIEKLLYIGTKHADRLAEVVALGVGKPRAKADDLG